MTAEQAPWRGTKDSVIAACSKNRLKPVAVSGDATALIARLGAQSANRP
jgi:hypothetical protein